MSYTAPQRSNPEWIQSMKDGKMQIGCAINSSSPLITEMVASMGYDFLLVDQQHSAIDTEKLRNLIQAAHAGRSRTVVRVGGAYDRIGIQQAFDLGSDGVLIPCSRTAEDVKHAISCAKYPVSGPGWEGGTRSVYLNIRPHFPGGFEGLIPYVQELGNKETFVAAQIETKDAYENIEEICKLPGLDCAFIGPGDLATDMGLVKKYGIPKVFSEPEFQEVTKKICETAKKNGVIAGFWNGDVENMGKAGFRFLVADGDVHAMQAALSESLKTKRAKIEELGFAPPPRS